MKLIMLQARRISSIQSIDIIKKSCPIGQDFLYTTRVCKPGSVLTAIYLSLSLPAGFSRLLGAVGQTYCSSTALLRDRVYIVKPMLPWAGWAMNPPFHLSFRKPKVVYLCCTCPGVAPGRRYLLSLPCEARTFLICSLSARIRGCPTRSRKYCTLSHTKCQIPLQNLLKMYIL